MIEALKKAANSMGQDSAKAVEDFKNSVLKSKETREKNGGLINVQTNA